MFLRVPGDPANTSRSFCYTRSAPALPEKGSGVSWLLSLVNDGWW
jgi:hypothetical protein